MDNQAKAWHETYERLPADNKAIIDSLFDNLCYRMRRMGLAAPQHEPADVLLGHLTRYVALSNPSFRLVASAQDDKEIESLMRKRTSRWPAPTVVQERTVDNRRVVQKWNSKTQDWETISQDETERAVGKHPALGAPYGEGQFDGAGASGNWAAEEPGAYATGRISEIEGGPTGNADTAPCSSEPSGPDCSTSSFD